MNEAWEGTPKGWIAPMSMENWTDQNLYTLDSHMFRRYLICLYYGILNIGQNDMMPKNNLEYLYMVLTLITSAILNAILFGSMAELIVSSSKTQVRIQDEADNNNFVMAGVNLDN
jgi:hypothetical protein